LDKHLHIVCFDVPYPADYGGVIDVFYKIKALHELGVKIHLHCFEYGRPRQSELNKYCEEVIYYRRNTGWRGVSLSLPYIVKSRANKGLLQNLIKDEHPVLLEGIHCTYFLFTDQLKNKKVFVRLHNVEYEYYSQLANNESSFFKRSYYNQESKLLKSYEKIIADEPTGNLDPETSDEIMQLLFHISRDYGTAVVMASHDYMVVTKFPARTIKTERGKVWDNASISIA